MNVLTKANKEVYQEIYETILQKNSKILDGFTKENKDKMKEITNKKASQYVFFMFFMVKSTLKERRFG